MNLVSFRNFLTFASCFLQESHEPPHSLLQGLFEFRGNCNVTGREHDQTFLVLLLPAVMAAFGSSYLSPLPHSSC